MKKITHTTRLHPERGCTLSFTVFVGADVMEGKVTIIGS